MKRKLSLLFISVVFFSGCNEAKNEAGVAVAPTVDGAAVSVQAAAATSSQPVDLSQVGSLKGVVKFEGTPAETRMLSVQGNPECAAFHKNGQIASEELVVNNGMLQNAFVYVKSGLEGRTFDIPKEQVKVENKGCVYVPHVVGAMVGQEILYINSDSTLHNVHSYPKVSKGFNLGLPIQGMKQAKKFDKPEVMVSLKCDVHPWMLGYVGVLEHPYFAVSDSSGVFSIPNLPAGEYTIEAWHEKLGVQTQQITVAANETKDIEFKFAG